jgi:hypothetical protein
MSDVLRVGTVSRRPTFLAEYVALLRVIVLVGVPVGLLAIGLGGRLAMFLLRLTSPPDVIGVTSDDGFEIGRFTLAGTYNLMNVGVAVGLIGALACAVVSPWLVGPAWLRVTTVGLTAGALVGSLILHADGVDFTRLQPRWLAVLLFLALPALVGALLLVLVDRATAAVPAASRGSNPWLPFALVVLAPLGVVVAAVPVLPVSAALVLLGRTVLPRLHRSDTGTLAVRAAFLVVPVLAVLALRRDLVALF